MSYITDFLAFRQAVMSGDFAKAVSITEKLDRKQANEFWDAINAEFGRMAQMKKGANRK